MMDTGRAILLPVLAIAAIGLAAAATPPDLLNYQGVLRDSTDAPLDGDFDMVFRFYSADTGGDETLVDRHTVADSAPVTVSGGLFNVALGSGQVADGSGPGTYGTLREVFRDHGEVWLQVEVAGETLDPRVRVVTAAYALNAGSLAGLDSSYFLDTSASEQTKTGSLVVDNGSTIARLGYGDRGLDAEGDTGVVGSGTSMGGSFHDTDDDGYARVGRGNVGIDAHGSSYGGFFSDLDSTGGAYLGDGDYGIRAHGGTVAGFFEDTDLTSAAYLGFGNTGVYGYGNTDGGYFECWGGSGVSRLGYGNTGVAGYGSYQGGYFVDSDSSGYSRLGYGTYKIGGSGGVSFIQNHPYDEDRVIVYGAPEGDEFATYTRGTGRLVDGVARIELGPTFQWVTNPDIGLTAHVTPRGSWADLYVESVTTSRLVVASRDETASAEFDYIVFGLRIGFEETAVVQEKEHESYIPSMADHRQLCDRRPELRAFNALERFKSMRVATERDDEIDLSASRVLRNAIVEFDPAIHKIEPQDRPGASERIDREDAPMQVGERPADIPEPADDPDGMTPGTSVEDDPRAFLAAPSELASWMQVSQPVEPGDLLAFDPESPGLLRPAATMLDPGIAGVVVAVVEAPGDGAPQQVLVALAGLVDCKVDAGYGEIRAGDLLTSSPTPGHAMRASDPIAGTIVGKAAEPHDTGTGIIKLLVMPG